MIDDFLLRAFLAGAMVALVAGPLGCFVVWRRLSYFGAALSHSALLGVALGFMLGLHPMVGIAVICILLALAFGALDRMRVLPSDTLLGILAHATLAVGMVVIAFMEHLRVDLMAYLFGDILAVSWQDLGLILVVGAAALVTLASAWRGLLAATVNEDLARVEGVATARHNMVLTVVLAVVIAVGMKIIGILMIVSLLIIPAATARRWSSTPEVMALLAAVLGFVAVVLGLSASLMWDLPAGPAIVTGSSLLLLFGQILPRRS